MSTVRRGRPWSEDRGSCCRDTSIVLYDLDIAADGTIYLTTLTSPTTGDLLRVDPRTRQPDIIASGPAMTSTRLATGFGPADGDLFVTSLNGDLLRVPVH